MVDRKKLKGLEKILDQQFLERQQRLKRLNDHLAHQVSQLRSIKDSRNDFEKREDFVAVAQISQAWQKFSDTHRRLLQEDIAKTRAVIEDQMGQTREAYGKVLALSRLRDQIKQEELKKARRQA